MKRVWLGGFIAVTVGAALAAVVARWRRGSFPTSESSLSLNFGGGGEESQPLANNFSNNDLSTQVNAPLPTSWARWTTFAVVLAVCALVLLGTPTLLTFGVFMGVIVGSLVVAYYSGGVQLPSRAGLRQALRHDLQPVIEFTEQHRVALSQGLALAAAGAMAGSAYLFRPEDLEEHLGWAIALFFIGGLALGGALRLRPAEALPTPVATKVKSGIRWRPLLLGVAGVALLAEINGMALQLEAFARVSLDFQFGLLCVSCILVVWGLGGLSRKEWKTALGHSTPPLAVVGAREKDTPTQPRFSSLRWEMLFLVALTILALALRLWDLGTTIRTLVDELHFTSGIMDLRTYDNIGLLRPMSQLSPFPWIYPYWQSFVVQLLGRTLFGFRATSAVIGTLNVLALYLLARTLFDRKTALLAGVLLAVLPPHIHFSRLGIIQIADPLFATLGFAFIGRGLVNNRRLDYALGGVLIAFTQYFYEAGRLLFPLLTAAWLIGVVFLWRKRLDPHRRNLWIMFIAFMLFTIPIYYTLFAQGKPLTERLSVSGSNADYWLKLLSGQFPFQAQLDHFKDAFLIYVHTLDLAPIYYGGKTPLLLIYIVPLFLLGVWVAVWRRRSPGALLVVLWLLSVSLGTSLLAGTAFYSRYLVVHPALALLVAVGIRYALPLILPTDFPKVVRYGLAGALVVVLAVGQVSTYFGPHLAEFQVQSRKLWDGRLIKDIYDVVLRSVDFPKGTKIHVVIDDMEVDVNFGVEMLRFFADGLPMDRVTSTELMPYFFEHLTPGVDHAFFLTADDAAHLEMLRAYLNLDSPQVSPYPMPPGTQFILYYASVANNSETLGKLPED